MVKGDPCRRLNSLSDRPVLFCPLPYSVNSRCFGFPGISASSNRGVRCALPRRPHLRDGVETLSRRSNWGKCGAHLAHFLAVRDHCPSLPDVQCLENCVVHIYHPPSGCFSQEGIHATWNFNLVRAGAPKCSFDRIVGSPNSMHSIQCPPSHYLGLRIGNVYLRHCSTHRERT